MRFSAHDTDITLDPTAANLTAAVTIADNDSATVSVTANDPSASETPTDPGQFTFSRTHVSPTLPSFPTRRSSDLTATTDYAALSGSVTILAGHSSAVIDVSGI